MESKTQMVSRSNWDGGGGREGRERSYLCEACSGDSWPGHPHTQSRTRCSHVPSCGCHGRWGTQEVLLLHTGSEGFFSCQCMPGETACAPVDQYHKANDITPQTACRKGRDEGRLDHLHWRQTPQSKWYHTSDYLQERQRWRQTWPSTLKTNTTKQMISHHRLSAERQRWRQSLTTYHEGQHIRWLRLGPRTW